MTWHFSMLLSLENLQKARQNEKREKEVRWNLSKKNGWERYKQLTEANRYKIANLVQDEKLDIERLMTKIEGIENKIKFKAFGKTSCKMKAVEKQKDNRKENSSAVPKCPVRGLAEASLLPSGPAHSRAGTRRERTRGEAALAWGRPTEPLTRNSFNSSR